MIIGKKEQERLEREQCAQISLLCRQKLMGYAESFEELGKSKNMVDVISLIFPRLHPFLINVMCFILPIAFSVDIVAGSVFFLLLFFLLFYCHN